MPAWNLNFVLTFHIVFSIYLLLYRIFFLFTSINCSLYNIVTSCLRRYGISTLKLLSRLICFYQFTFIFFPAISIILSFFFFGPNTSFFHWIKIISWSSNLLVAICSMIADSTSKSNIHEAGLYRDDNYCKWTVQHLNTHFFCIYVVVSASLIICLEADMWLLLSSSNRVLFECMQSQTVSELKDFVKKLNSLPEMTVCVLWCYFLWFYNMRSLSLGF